LYEKTFKIRKNEVGNIHMDTGCSLNNIGLIHLRINTKGHDQQALKHFKEAFKIAYSILSISPLTATCLFNIGTAYHKLNNLQKAEILFNRCLKMRKELYKD
jgi:tetratricopeptide (TPR) repeat protein